VGGWAPPRRFDEIPSDESVSAPRPPTNQPNNETGYLMNDLLEAMIDSAWDDVNTARTVLRLAEERAESWSALYAKWQDDGYNTAAA
jgi:hypothetical protein